jgi:hypothetical protein
LRRQFYPGRTIDGNRHGFGLPIQKEKSETVDFCPIADPTVVDSDERRNGREI